MCVCVLNSQSKKTLSSWNALFTTGSLANFFCIAIRAATCRTHVTYTIAVIIMMNATINEIVAAFAAHVQPLSEGVAVKREKERGRERCADREEENRERDL